MRQISHGLLIRLDKSGAWPIKVGHDSLNQCQKYALNDHLIPSVKEALVQKSSPASTTPFAGNERTFSAH
jgi:hypothetical protein